jgi:MFS family permease
MVLGGKLVGWLGRGVRGPLRDAILADTIPVGARGRAFGFHRFGDTVGAVLGPLAAGILLARMGGASSLTTVRSLIAWSAVPGVLAAVVFWVLVRERNRTRRPARSFRHAMRNLPKDFRRYLVGVGLFGLGDYAHTMLILAAVQLLTPLFGALEAAAAGAALYTMHNAVYAIVTYPTGVLADRVGHRRILGVGYAISVSVPVLLIGCFVGHWGLPALIAAFAVAGLVNGIQDTLEAAATAELVPETDRALGFGVLGAVNGVGDLASSLVVGWLWTVEPALGFGYAAVGMAAGALVTLAGAGDHRAYDGSR